MKRTKWLLIVLAAIVCLLTSSCSVAKTESTVDSNNYSNSELEYGEQDNFTENSLDSTSHNLNSNPNQANTSKTNTGTQVQSQTNKQSPVGNGKATPVKTSSIPAYSGKPYITLNNNQPSFSSSELTTKAYERYSSLDSYGRCRTAIATCGKEIMPKNGEERGSISSVKPSGWVQAKYSGISGGYLWNRCHLIGWQLSAENANPKNLITGTRHMNINGMLPFENMVADYIKETGNHVAYRVTPIYSGSNLVCSGVQIEAYSIEDNGDGICFNVYCYNVQPGININYATGASSESGTPTTKQPTTNKPTTTKTAQKTTTTTTKRPPQTDSGSSYGEMVWIPSSGTKYHSKSSCSGMENPSQVTLSEAEQLGYEPCKKCFG